MKRINMAVFVSGSGTNCENIIRYFSTSDRYHVALVVSNRPDAYALVRADCHSSPISSSMLSLVVSLTSTLPCCLNTEEKECGDTMYTKQ